MQKRVVELSVTLEARQAEVDELRLASMAADQVGGFTSAASLASSMTSAEGSMAGSIGSAVSAETARAQAARLEKARAALRAAQSELALAETEARVQRQHLAVVEDDLNYALMEARQPCPPGLAEPRRNAVYTLQDQERHTRGVVARAEARVLAAKEAVSVARAAVGGGSAGGSAGGSGGGPSSGEAAPVEYVYMQAPSGPYDYRSTRDYEYLPHGYGGTGNPGYESMVMW